MSEGWWTALVLGVITAVLVGLSMLGTVLGNAT